MIFRFVSGAVALVLLGAAIGLSGSDPFRWTLLYGLGATLAGIGAVGRLWWKHAAAYGLLGVSVGGVHLVAGGGLREAIGALVAGGLVGGLAWWRRRVDPDQPRPFSELGR